MNEGDKTGRNSGFSRLAETGLIVGGAGFYTAMGAIVYELAMHFNDPEKIQLTPLAQGGVIASIIGTVALGADMALSIRREGKEARTRNRTTSGV